MGTTIMPSRNEILDILSTTQALRQGHFELPTGIHTNMYFQMPLALRSSKHERVLCVALSRILRNSPRVISTLPHCAIVAPASGGIPVAFAVRTALGADQFFWAERSDGTLNFRQFTEVKPGDRCIVVDDILLTGKTLQDLMALIRRQGGEVIAAAVLVDPRIAAVEFGDVPFHALIQIPTQRYADAASCALCTEKVPLTKVGW